MTTPQADYKQTIDEFFASSGPKLEETLSGIEPPEELTAGQKDAWREVLEELSSGPMASLLGAAGTGKTFLATRLAEALSKEGVDVLAAAPTHQAVGQLEKLYDGDSISVSTIQSALGLQLKPDGRGGYYLAEGGEPTIDKYDLAIADEASMIGMGIWRHLPQAEVKWLFVGDPYQLPPVSESPSPALQQPGAKLTQIVRQAKGNPIIDLATQIRNGGGFYPLPEETTNGDLGIYQVRQYKAAEKAARAAKKNPAGTRVFAWRNDTVSKWCRRIKNAVYPGEGRFAEGMHLLAQSGHAPGPYVKFHTSELLEVEAARKENSQLGEEGPTVPSWSLDLRRKSTEQLLEDVPVPRGQGKEKLEEYLEITASREDWPEHYDAKEKFAEVRFAASTTVHKSQGQTIDTAFVDVDDLRASKSEFQELAYVAATRPAKHLVLIT